MVSRNKGLTLVEVMIASAIILTAVVTLLGVHNLYLKVAFSNSNAVKAAYLAEEGLEAMRFLRDLSWSTHLAPLAIGTEYGVVLSVSAWQVNPANKYVENFERTVSIALVYRDANGDIVASGGTLDPDTLLVTSSVAWASGGATTTKAIATYLTNLYEN
jgi:prepilin-type N-terminal cleavage/methylation domain-containing protein